MAELKPGHVCIAIAVSAPESLDALPGALTAADQVMAWGTAQGYRTLLITDDPGRTGKATHKVDCDRLRKEITPFISDPNVDHERLVIAFAGHGLIEQVKDFWLLSDWFTGAEQIVDVTLMRQRLNTYQYKQLTIISDACRTTLPNEDPTLQGSRIFERSGWDAVVPDADILLATALGKPAYMVTGKGGTAPHCLFTDVVTKALNGTYPESVDPDHPKGIVVSSQTLKVAVRKQIELAASGYGQSQVADVSTNFTRPDDVYTVLPAVPVAPEQAGRTFRGRGGPKLNFGVPKDFGADPVLLAERRARTEDVAERIARWTRFPSRGRGANLVTLFGARPLAVSVGQNMSATFQSSSQLWPEVRIAGGAGSVALRIAHPDRWIVVANYPGLSLTVTMGDSGAEGLFYGNEANAFRQQRPDTPSVRAIAAMQTGDLEGLDALDLAAAIRQEKHAAPVLGVIAAYLYARVGDVENIRRMAWYYSSRGQPVPYDLALLGGLKVSVGDSRLLVASVPETSSRPPETALEARFPYTGRATPAVEVPVAGNAPWLRQGWDLIEDSGFPDANFLHSLTPGLTPALFSTLDAKRGQKFADWLEQGVV